MRDRLWLLRNFHFGGRARPLEREMLKVIKTLSKSIREYKLVSILSPLFVTIEVVLECILPLIVIELLNALKAEGGIDMPLLIGYGVLLISLSFLALVFGALAGATCARAAAGFGKNLRKDMYYNIQNFSFENIDRFSPSSLITRMTTDVTWVQMSYMMIVRLAIRCPIMVIFSFIMAIFMGGSLAYIFLAVIPVLTFALFFIMKKVMPLFNRVFKKYDALNESIQENVKGMRVVKSFVREEYEKHKFDQTAEEVKRDFTRAERILAWNHPIMQFAFYGVLSSILFIGSYLALSSGGAIIDYVEVSQLIVYGMQILVSLMMFSMCFAMISMSVPEANRIAEILNEKSTIVSPEHPVYEVKDGSVSFENVFFKYSENAERFVLSDIQLNIKSGETVGIIGGTGSSKTSLVNLISRLYDVTQGSVKVGGVDVREYDLDTIRNQVAVVLQKNVLFSGTIKENLRWGDPNATDEELIQACKLAQADEFITRFPKGYDTYIEQGGVNVSGGQKQRLCIARALLKKPKILILDDSTSAVDTHTDALIRKAFREYLPDTTKIIIAQRISSVQDADKIIVMESGKIVAVGTHASLLGANQIYTEVYESQNRISDEKGGESDEN